jgi:succinyl-CoA synthetase beta subunit
MTQLKIEDCENILEKYGIKLLHTFHINSDKELEEASKKLEYPVVMKVFSEEVIHKFKSGLVKTNIGDKEELHKSYSRLISLIKKKKLNNFSIGVQSQIEGMEFIAGAKRDATFGYVVIFGLGGVNAELLNKVSMRICPIHPKDANGMVNEIASKMIGLETKNKIANLLVKVSKLCVKEDISEMDLNPVIVNKRGIYLVDVRMIK